MSDTGRKDISQQIKETVTPESQKSTGEKFKEGVTGKADNVGSGAQPDSQKSGTQKVTDSLTGSGNSGNNTAQSGGGLMDKVKGTFSGDSSKTH